MDEENKNDNQAFRSAMTALLEYYEREKGLDDLVHLSIDGIHKVETLPKMIQSFEKAFGTDADYDIETAKKLSDLASNEVNSDFPLLHSQATITLWGLLEAVVRNLFASILQNVPRSRETEAFKRIKVNVSEYDALHGLDRYLYLVDGMEEALSTRRKTGIERFEILFRSNDMSSPVEKDVVTCLLELYHCRNVLVHRHGRVDRKLLTDCSWLKLQEGSELRISHEQYHQYSAALSLYVFVIQSRVYSYFGKNPINHGPDCKYASHEFEFDSMVTSEPHSRQTTS